MQLRRLDPLAKAGPYQRLGKSLVRSFSLREAHFDRVAATRPELVVIEGESGVVALPNRDYLQIHYGFPNLTAFSEQFTAMFSRIIAGSSKQEAPRGVVIPFQDRNNRRTAEPLFWGIGLKPGDEWVEMNYIAIPALEAPADELGNGHRLRDLEAGELQLIGELDAEATGLAPLSTNSIDLLQKESKLLRLVVDTYGSPVGYVSLHTEPDGWGVIESITLGSKAEAAARPLLVDWAVAWLRNNGGRRIRCRRVINDPELVILRDKGFAGGETGINFYGPVDAKELEAVKEERKTGHIVRPFRHPDDPRGN